MEITKNEQLSDIELQLKHLNVSNNHEKLEKLFTDMKLSLPLELDSSQENMLEGHSNCVVNKMLCYMPPIEHSHNHFEIYSVISGECLLKIQNNKNKIILYAGDVVIIAAGTKHSLSINNDETSVFGILIHEAMFQTAFSSVLDGDQYMLKVATYAIQQSKKSEAILFHCEPSDISSTVLNMFDEWENNRLYKKNMLDVLIFSFFITLLRNYDETKFIPISKNKKIDLIIVDIINVILGEYSHLTLKELAKKFNYSERQMSRIVQDYLGKSFRDFIGELRMKEAKKLLSEGELSIKDIASRVGFSEISHFYYSFSKNEKCTPVEYRNRIKNGGE